MAGTSFDKDDWSGYDEQSVTNPGSALTDFTLLIDISDLSSDFASSVQSDGADIRTTKGDDTELPYALVEWDYNSGDPNGVIAVKWSGTLASSGVQNVRVYAGYTPGTATAYTASETYGSDNAFDSSHLAFWHFSDGATDWTSNGNDLTGGGSPSYGNVAGEVGSAWDTLGTSWAYNSTNITGNTDQTIVTWLKLHTTTGTEYIFDASSGTNGGVQSLKLSGGSTVRTRVDDDGANAGVFDTATNALGTSSWNQIACRLDKSGNAQHYLNSAASGGTLDISGYGDISATRGHVVAAASSGGASSVDADISLHSLHSTLRSTDWLDEFNAMRDQATFWGAWGWQQRTRRYTLTTLGVG